MTSGIPASQPDHAAVIDDWRTISEELLQGLVHALNNRVAALSAFVELAKLGDEDGDPLIVLPAEIAQLHRVNSLFGLLPERKADAEALDLRAAEPGAAPLDRNGLREMHARKTGAGSGLGKACAIALAGEGAISIVTELPGDAPVLHEEVFGPLLTFEPVESIAASCSFGAAPVMRSTSWPPLTTISVGMLITP